MAQKLSGKVAIITDASSGIGRALANTLAAEGVKLVLVGRSAERLQDVAKNLSAVESLVLPLDLAKPAEVERVASEALARFGRIDILLANAGLYHPGKVTEGNADTWDEMLAVNVNSVFRLCRAVLPQMIKNRSGDIVVTSSIAGHAVISGEAVYAASKHAVQAFVHDLRRQVAPHNVRVGAVAPGTVLNELWGYRNPAEIEAKVASHDGLRSEDVAEAVLFMLTRPANVTIRDLVILPQNQDI
ncbi:MAG TPA: SDR family oxidoreductase [Aestuariivirga sp.]|nr:SDR family oxidoreductase [Aestuariivirga sp.]